MVNRSERGSREAFVIRRMVPEFEPTVANIVSVSMDILELIVTSPPARVIFKQSRLSARVRCGGGRK